MAETITHYRFGPDDLDCLLAVQDGLFDGPMLPDQARAFLNDPQHELILAFDGDQAVGMISAVVLFHPDKQPAMFIAELGVRESHQRRGIATALVAAMKNVAHQKNCKGIWLGTEADNVPALALYRGIAEQEVRGSYFGWDDAL